MHFTWLPSKPYLLPTSIGNRVFVLSIVIDSFDALLMDSNLFMLELAA